VDGRFPLKVNGEVVGAIGVSGAPTVQHHRGNGSDVRCELAISLVAPPVSASFCARSVEEGNHADRPTSDVLRNEVTIGN